MDIENSVIENSVIELLKLQIKEKKLQQKIAETKTIIQKHFDRTGYKKLLVKRGDDEFRATKSERAYVNYYFDKLVERLDKEVLSEIINKEYTVNNIEKLTALLKKHKVKPKDFKKYITKQETLNRERLNHLYEIGDITGKDLKGCYDAKIVKSISVKKLGE